MNLLQKLFAFCILGLALQAHAQRTPVPVVSFENVPVSLSAEKRLEAAQVKQAIEKAAPLAKWVLVPQADGTFEAIFTKEGKHTVVVQVRYDSEKYSVRYVSSENMKFIKTADFANVANVQTHNHMVAAAEASQRKRFASRLESAYVVSDPASLIHPFYEDWVHILLYAIRIQLRAAASSESVQ
jgi:hypothetical protein